MTKRVFWFGIAAWALVVAAPGCEDNSCKVRCEEARECSNVTEPVEDCQQYCVDLDKFLKAAACTTQQQKFDECRDGLADSCNAAQLCPTQVKAFQACKNTYCTANPGAAGCP